MMNNFEGEDTADYYQVNKVESEADIKDDEEENDGEAHFVQKDNYLSSTLQQPFSYKTNQPLYVINNDQIVQASRSGQVSKSQNSKKELLISNPATNFKLKKMKENQELFQHKEGTSSSNEMEEGQNDRHAKSMQFWNRNIEVRNPRSL